MKRNLGDVSFKPAQAMQQTNLNLGSISSRPQQVTHNSGSMSSHCRRAKKGVGVWKLDREFGKDGAGKLSCGCGVAITQQGDIAITNYLGDPSIKFYNANGYFKSKFSFPGNPWNVEVGPDGRMFVTNWTKQVSVYDVEGNLKPQFPAKSPDNVSSDAQDKQLWSLAIDNCS